MSILVKEDYANPIIPLWASAATSRSYRPIEVYQGQLLNVTLSNLGYTQILPTNTFTLPASTSRIRMTVAINCFSGLGNNEHLQVYLAMTDGVINPQGDMYSATYPFVKGSEGIGGMEYPATMTIVDSMDGLSPSPIPTNYNYQIFAKTVTGSHTCSFNVYVTIDIV